MSKLRRSYNLEAASTAVDWTVFDVDDFDVRRVALIFASAPASSGDITITRVSSHGPAFDLLLRAVDPRSATHISIENIDGLVKGDQIKIEYANPDSISVAVTAVLEL